MVFYSKLFTCPFHSLHFSIGFQRLPSRQSGPIGSLGPSFHSLPSYDLLRSCALPSVLKCFEITSHFMVFYSKLFTCPFHSLHFSFGFNVYLPGFLGLLICLVLAFTHYQAMIYYAAVHYPAFLDVFRLPYISRCFTASFSPAPSIAYIFHLGFNVYLPGFLGLLICLVLAFTRYQAMIYYAAVHYPALLDVLRLPYISWYFTASFHLPLP